MNQKQIQLRAAVSRPSTSLEQAVDMVAKAMELTARDAALNRTSLRVLRSAVDETQHLLDAVLTATSGEDDGQQLRKQLRRLVPSDGSNLRPTTATEEGAAYTFDPITMPDGNPARSDLIVASILDPFSEVAFSLEWSNVALDPERWREQLDAARPHLLFVESAWEGNSGAWKYHLVGQSAPRPAVVDLITYCQDQGIPTVFWSKEDPPHFDEFLDTAKLFDYIFTTDAECVERYREACGHERIYTLPFAAHPRIHNPARPGKVDRERQIAFGGMYFRHKFPERREQMDYLLPAASEFDLDIYSRQLGGDSNYQFPEPYNEYVRGALAYPEMLTAYHAYKVFLNVNSVVTSPSMCARRIFEITACGGAVVSPENEAINHFFQPDELSTVTDLETTRTALKALLRSPHHRDKMVHRAQRAIWEKHTYTHRVNTVLDALGFRTSQMHQAVSIMVSTIRPENLDLILENVERQDIDEIQLCLMCHGFDIDEDNFRARAAEHGITDLKILRADRDVSLGECLNQLVAASDGKILTKMDDDDYYGQNYLKDLVHALKFSGAELVGKGATYFHFERDQSVVISYKTFEHRYCNFIRGATLTGGRDVFEANPFESRSVSEDSHFLQSVMQSGGQLYASDRFNYFVRRVADKSQHTWKIDDERLFASGELVMYGNPVAHVTA